MLCEKKKKLNSPSQEKPLTHSRISEGCSNIVRHTRNCPSRGYELQTQTHPTTIEWMNNVEWGTIEWNHDWIKVWVCTKHWPECQYCTQSRFRLMPDPEIWGRVKYYHFRRKSMVFDEIRGFRTCQFFFFFWTWPYFKILYVPRQLEARRIDPAPF